MNMLELCELSCQLIQNRGAVEWIISEVVDSDIRERPRKPSRPNRGRKEEGSDNNAEKEIDVGGQIRDRKC